MIAYDLIIFDFDKLYMILLNFILLCIYLYILDMKSYISL